MTQKETLDIVFKFSALLVFAFLFNKSIENRPLAQFEGAFPLKDEQMIVMEMDNIGEVDLEEIIDIDGEDQMEVRVEKEIINGKEQMKAISPTHDSTHVRPCRLQIEHYEQK